jgi:hypothetical protein
MATNLYKYVNVLRQQPLTGYSSRYGKRKLERTFKNAIHKNPVTLFGL